MPHCTHQVEVAFLVHILSSFDIGSSGDAVCEEMGDFCDSKLIEALDGAVGCVDGIGVDVGEDDCCCSCSMS